MKTKSTADLADEELLLTDFQLNHVNHNTKNDGEAIDDVMDKDLDIFEMALAYQDDGQDPLRADVPVRLPKEESLEIQSIDDFCQTVGYSPDNPGTSTLTYSKATTAPCDDYTRLNTRLSNSYYRTRSDVVCRTFFTTRNWPATPDRSACTDISVKRIIGHRWPTTYTKRSATVLTVQRTA